MRKLKILDLFSGIGGFSLGLEKTGGFETVAFCEIDSYCQQVLKKHWPETPIYSDVSRLYYRNNTLFAVGKDTDEKYKILEKTSVDVICGGFPCQDISVAGKKKGLIDEEGKTTRSGLWFEFKRLINQIKPKYVIIENVANLRSNGLATVIKDLWEIGYVGEWHIISARAVGACHLRERIWVIAYPYSSSIRNQSERSKIGRNHLQTEGQAITGNDGQERNAESGNSQSIGLKGLRTSGQQVSHSHDEEGLSLCPGEDLTDSDSTGLQGQRTELEAAGSKGRISEAATSKLYSPNTDHLRLWKPFATEEEKQVWWTSATASFRDWWETQSTVCRVDDGLSHRLDKDRAKRVKALGNTIVPFIPELIGNAILEFERQLKSHNENLSDIQDLLS